MQYYFLMRCSGKFQLPLMILRIEDSRLTCEEKNPQHSWKLLDRLIIFFYKLYWVMDTSTSQIPIAAKCGTWPENILNSNCLHPMLFAATNGTGNVCGWDSLAPNKSIKESHRIRNCVMAAGKLTKAAGQQLASILWKSSSKVTIITAGEFETKVKWKSEHCWDKTGTIPLEIILNDEN